MPVEFVMSEKGKRKLLLDGHFFFKEKESVDQILWKCENYQKTKCKVRVKTVNDVVTVRGEHNHVGDAAGVEAAKIYEAIKTTAKTTTNAPQAIITDATIQCSQAAAPKLPTIDVMKRTIRHIRQQQRAGPALPNHRQEIEFPEEYTRTLNGEDFLLYDSGPEEDRMVVFSTRRNMQLLAGSDHWYADGTFKTVPLLFHQLYTIHGLKENAAVPLVYALLPDKSEATYTRLLRAMKNLEPLLSPRTVTTDYEKAMNNAFRTEFPNARLKGCFFHFTQCIFRNIQNRGLKQRYETDANFALHMRMLSAIAFVPPASVVHVFETLVDNDVFPPEAQEVIDYFEDTWIGRPNRRQRRPPQYPIEMWSVYETILEDLPKTNNSVEGWHRGFQEQIGAMHPNIWKFIDCVKKEQNLNEVRIEQYVSGVEPQPSKRKYRDCARRIKNIVDQYNPDNILDYIRGIAHNISY